MLAETVYIICAYLLGAFPHLNLMARLYKLDANGDLHLKFWRHRGRTVGLIAVLLHIAKGVIIVLAGMWMNMDTGIIAISGVVAIAGQTWPVFSGFDGERGNSIAIGVVATLKPVTFLISLVPMVARLTIKVARHLSNSQITLKERLKFRGPPSLSLPIGMAIAFLLLPVASWQMGDPPTVYWCYLSLFLLIMLRRATASLDRDIDKGTNIGAAIRNRLLYDRSQL